LPNEKNLKPVRSKSEARERGRAGGKKSGVARRQRKSLKDSMNLLLSLEITDKKRLDQALKMGFEERETDNSVLVTLALFDKAVKGDVMAIKELRSLIEETSNDTGILENLLKGLLDESIQP